MMKKTLMAVALVASLLLAGCAQGLYAVYKNPASGDVLLVYEDGTTKRMPVLLDGAVLTGIIEYWQKNSGGLTPSPFALVQVNPDGTFKIKWVKGGPGLTDKLLGILSSAAQGAGAAAISGAMSGGHTESVGHSGAGHAGGDDDTGAGHNDDGHDDGNENHDNGNEDESNHGHEE